MMFPPFIGAHRRTTAQLFLFGKAFVASLLLFYLLQTQNFASHPWSLSSYNAESQHHANSTLSNNETPPSPWSAWVPKLHHKAPKRPSHNSSSPPPNNSSHSTSPISSQSPNTTVQAHYTLAYNTADQLTLLQKTPIPHEDLARKGHHTHLLSTLLRATLSNPTIPPTTFLNLTSVEFPFFEESRIADSLAYLPWQPSTPDISGIVICVGAGNAVMAAQNIRVLRNVLGSTLPIEIAYAGEDDLPERWRKRIEGLGPNIEFVNLHEVFDNDKVGMGGYFMKPFALLASRFQKPMLLDADVIFLRSPDELFTSDSGLAETGTLFYHDRAVYGDSTGWLGTLAWIKEVLGERKPSRALRQSIFWQETLEHQMESGVVVMDKGRPGVFASLVFAAWMNTWPVRGFVMSHVCGDKESYWLAAELSDTLYTFNPNYASMIGHHEPSSTEMCSCQLMHTDIEGVPFWFNAGLQTNKQIDDEDSQGFAKLTHFLGAGASWDEQFEWRYQGANLFCANVSESVVGEPNLSMLKTVEDVGLARVIERILEEAKKADVEFQGVDDDEQDKAKHESDDDGDKDAEEQQRSENSNESGKQG